MSRPDIIFYTLICKDGNGMTITSPHRAAGQKNVDNRVLSLASFRYEGRDKVRYVCHVTFVSMVPNRIGHKMLFV